MRGPSRGRPSARPGERQSLSTTLLPLVGDVPVDEFILQIEAYWRRPPLHSDAKPFLDSLRVPVCCVSNADRAHLDDAIALHGLQFDAVVTSECAQCYKPGGRIFELASATIGVKPARLMNCSHASGTISALITLPSRTASSARFASASEKAFSEMVDQSRAADSMRNISTAR